MSCHTRDVAPRAGTLPFVVSAVRLVADPPTGGIRVASVWPVHTYGGGPDGPHYEPTLQSCCRRHCAHRMTMSSAEGQTADTRRWAQITQMRPEAVPSDLRNLRRSAVPAPRAMGAVILSGAALAQNDMLREPGAECLRIPFGWLAQETECQGIPLQLAERT